MNQRRSFYRKIAYGAAMAALLIGLSMLSLPNSYGKQDGGKLAELREDYGLSQGNLGEVDPASETIKLATLGMRGIAVQRLWDHAFEMKKTENWSEFSATLELLAKLQPNFITFWKYQSWNVSYNVSVEFDDYRDRYYYVRRGIDFLKRGQSYNRENPQLLWELGWFLGQKIGRSDEKQQFRRLFKADDDYHNEDVPPAQRDNWLRSRYWYELGVAAAEEKGIGRKSPVIFFSSPAKSQMNYGEAIEEEGLFDRGLQAWKRAAEMWRAFGTIEVEHSTGVKMRLNEAEYTANRAVELREELERLGPGVYEALQAEKRSALTEPQREALATPEEQWTAAQRQEVFLAERSLKISSRELADRIIEADASKRRDALSLASKIADFELQNRYIGSYRDICNFDYWMTRAEFEQTEYAVQARELLYRGWRAFVKDSDPIAAQELYEQGLAKWRAVFDQFPSLWSDEGTTGDDVMIEIVRYNRILEQLDEQIPDDFPLWRVVEDFDADRELEGQLRAYQQRMLKKEATPATPPDDQPAVKAEGTADDDQTGDQPAVGPEAAATAPPGRRVATPPSRNSDE